MRGRPKRKVSIETQRAIVSGLCDGRGSSQIADAMGFCPDTIDRYIEFMYRQYGAKSRSQLVHIWHVNKLI